VLILGGARRLAWGPGPSTVCQVQERQDPALRQGPVACQEMVVLHAVEAVVDGAERVADDRAEDHEGRDNNDGNQNKNQRIFDQTLAFLFRGE